MDRILHDLKKIAAAQREYLKIQREIAEAQGHMCLALDKLYSDLIKIHGGFDGTQLKGSDTGVRLAVGDGNCGVGNSAPH